MIPVNAFLDMATLPFIRSAAACLPQSLPAAPANAGCGYGSGSNHGTIIGQRAMVRKRSIAPGRVFSFSSERTIGQKPLK